MMSGNSKINHSISLVVPVFNEQELIEETLNIYQEHLSNLFNSYELLVVDDGSTDSTPKILQSLRKSIPDLRVITHPKNLGVGRAIFDGFKQAKLDWVMYNSADQPFDLRDLRKTSKLFDTSDVIVTIRTSTAGKVFWRRLASKFNVWLLKSLFKVPVDDFQFVQIYKREVIRSIRLDCNDAFGQAEMLIKLYKKGCKISQLPVKFHPRVGGSSKFNNPLRHLTHLKDLLSFWLLLRQKR